MIIKNINLCRHYLLSFASAYFMYIIILYTSHTIIIVFLNVYIVNLVILYIMTEIGVRK